MSQQYRLQVEQLRHEIQRELTRCDHFQDNESWIAFMFRFVCLSSTTESSTTESTTDDTQSKQSVKTNILHQLEQVHPRDPSNYIRKKQIIFQAILNYNHIQNWELEDVVIRDFRTCYGLLRNKVHPSDKLEVRIESLFGNLVTHVPSHIRHIAIWNQDSYELKIVQIKLDPKAGITANIKKAFNIPNGEFKSVEITQNPNTSHLLVTCTPIHVEQPQVFFFIHLLTFDHLPDHETN